ncbi:MAG: allantoinase AllB [Actinomycetota bacterium]|nr:allantoinase AllB [Actinomycetota bacterium]
MTHELVLRAARVITPQGQVSACVAVDGGVITGVLPHDARPDTQQLVEVAAECVLLPGLVDTHVHVNEPGRTEWEGFDTATRAAAAGGVTTLLDMPLNSIPATVDLAALEAKRAAATGQCHVDVGFWGGAVPGNFEHLVHLQEAGVFGFKCFLLPSGVPEFPALGAGELGRYLARLVELDALMIIHAEDPDLIQGAPPAAGPDYAAFLHSRPRAAEARAIQTVIESARRTGARVHIVHLSNADALAMIIQAKAEGVRLTVETCPHYLAFDSSLIPDGATQFKCCPPIREPANRERLWRGLTDGAIDFVVSDHSPCVPELKMLESGDFARAWGGIASVELSLPAVWTEAARRGHDLGDIVGWMAQGPAAFAGLRAKGGIVPGRDADFAVFAPDEHFVVQAASLQQRNPITPYDGRTLRGVVRETWLRGQRISFDEPAGQLLDRTTPQRGAAP